MNIIEKLARKSYQDNIEFSNGNIKDSVNNIKYLVYDIVSQLDKIKFLNVHIDLANENYLEHLKVYHDPENCQQNEEAEACEV